MNSLHRELAPISDAAWAQIEEEASRTIKRYLAGRRVVDVQGPSGSPPPPSAPAIYVMSRCRTTGSLHDSARSSRQSISAFLSNSIANRSTTWSVAPTI